MDDVGISESSSKVDHDLLAKNVDERLWTYPVSEDPPGDGHHPHDNEDHGDDVIEQVAAELAQTAGLVVTALHLLRDVRHQLVEGYPEQQEEADTKTTRD